MYLAVLMVVLAIFMVACSGQEQETEPTYQDYGDMEEAMPETLPPVQIKMPDYEFTYSGEFQDVIQVTAAENEGGLMFSVKLSQKEEVIFTLIYNTDDGELVTVLEDTSGNRIPVAFRMNPIPENLSDADLDLFCSAQEAVNEIVASLILK